MSVLGYAGPGYYSLLVEGSTGTFSMSDSTVDGNVGIATNPVNNAPCSGWGGGANAAITGTIYNNGSGCNTGGVTPAGGTSSTFPGGQSASALISDVNTAVTDFSNAATDYGAVAATGVTNNQAVSSAVTITAASSGWSVANLASITESNGNLTISGTANSQLVINVGSIDITNGEITLTGGITPWDVVFNVTGGSDALTINSAGTSDGIFIAPGTGNSLHDQTVNGEVISGLSGLAISSSFTLDDTYPSATPEPDTYLLFGGALVGLAFGGKKLAAWQQRRR